VTSVRALTADVQAKTKARKTADASQAASRPAPAVTTFRYYGGPRTPMWPAPR